MNKNKEQIKSQGEHFYITTPIYYASGKPHLGHAYTSIAADVLARWNRNLGKEVFFQTGTDEHGQKVANKAKEIGKSPKAFVDSLIPDFKELLEVMNISHDYFIRTTNKSHKLFVQDMLQKAFDNGDIYKANYTGLYCVDCEKYYKEEDLLEGNICPDHKRKVEQMSEENYFFRLSKYQDQLLNLYKENPEFLSPNSKAKETINRVKEGLEDISISRSKDTLEWGIEFPFDDNHVTYVWFDALFNYVSGLKINRKDRFWPANIHLVGKDIMWFHKVYWPAFLMSCGYEPPKKVFAHGWWTVNGEKMGKSMGNAIEPIEVAKLYGTDQFRYFLMVVGAFGDDLDFSYDMLAEKINNDLKNDFGNLVSRVHAMVSKYFDGKVPGEEELSQDEVDILKKLNIFKQYNTLLQSLQFNKALELLWTSIRDTNAYINKVEPWKEQDQKRLKAILNTLVFAIKMFADYVDCFMPETALRIRKQFNFKKSTFKAFRNVPGGHEIGEKDNLFEKIELENEGENTKINSNYNDNNDNNKNNQKSNSDQQNQQDQNQKDQQENKLKAVIFDFDGVIHNTFDIHYKAFQDYLGKEMSVEEYRSYVAGDIFNNGYDIDTTKYMEIVTNQLLELQINPNVKREIQSFAKNYELYIISSGSEEMMADYFKRNELEGVFKSIYGFQTHKSKREKFKMIFNENNLNKDNSVFVTDTLGDILEANEVGIKTIAVDFGYNGREKLEEGKPFAIVNKFKKIRKEIKKLNNDNSVISEELGNDEQINNISNHNQNQIEEKSNYVFLHGFLRNETILDPLKWLNTKLTNPNNFCQTLPNADKPNLEEQMKFVLENAHIDENTTIVTHSLGGLLAMNLIEKNNLKIKKLVMLAPKIKSSGHKHKDSIPEIDNYFNEELDFEKIKSSVKEIVVFEDKNDHVIIEGEPKKVAELLDAKYILIDAPKSHFNCLECDDVLTELKPKQNQNNNNKYNNTKNQGNNNNQDQQIGFDTLNLKIGQIEKVEKVENSEKLYRLQINLGDEKRQILSGLQQIYKQEELENRKVVVITNLKEARLAGEISQGMVLAVEDQDLGHGDCGLLNPNPDLEIGTNLTCADKTANNSQIINYKKFSKVQMIAKEGKIFYQDNVIEGIFPDKNFKGNVC